jgi:hypothetical protein
MNFVFYNELKDLKTYSKNHGLKFYTNDSAYRYSKTLFLRLHCTVLTLRANGICL